MSGLLRAEVAASLVEKLREAKVKIGDVIAILRTEDYVSKTYGTKGKSFELKIISRAK